MSPELQASYFHGGATEAIKQRCNVVSASHHLESEQPTAPITSLQLEDILPNYTDYKQLRTNFIILLARIITSRFEQFKCLSSQMMIKVD